jgi:hypothetical protein
MVFAPPAELAFGLFTTAEQLLTARRGGGVLLTGLIADANVKS